MDKKLIFDFLASPGIGRIVVGGLYTKCCLKNVIQPNPVNPE
jgi:hypothetical protein